MNCATCGEAGHGPYGKVCCEISHYEESLRRKGLSRVGTSQSVMPGDVIQIHSTRMAKTKKRRKPEAWAPSLLLELNVLLKRGGVRRDKRKAILKTASENPTYLQTEMSRWT